MLPDRVAPHLAVQRGRILGDPQQAPPLQRELDAEIQGQAAGEPAGTGGLHGRRRPGAKQAQAVQAGLDAGIQQPIQGGGIPALGHHHVQVDHHRVLLPAAFLAAGRSILGFS